MADIDYLTCSMDDVINRSLLMHPSVFGDALAAVAKIHRQARDTVLTGKSRMVADDMCLKAWAMFKAIQDGELVAADLDLSSRLMAFSAAAKLNCLSFNVAHSIAARG
jgi:hypothetical protein